jgi:preprotein translocase subunit SecG
MVFEVGHKLGNVTSTQEENSMTLNKLTFVLSGMFVTGAVFFSILLRRSQEVHDEVLQLRNRLSIPR